MLGVACYVASHAGSICVGKGPYWTSQPIGEHVHIRATPTKATVGAMREAARGRAHAHLQWLTHLQAHAMSRARYSQIASSAHCCTCLRRPPGFHGSRLACKQDKSESIIQALCLAPCPRHHHRRCRQLLSACSVPTSQAPQPRHVCPGDVVSRPCLAHPTCPRRLLAAASAPFACRPWHQVPHAARMSACQ